MTHYHHIPARCASIFVVVVVVVVMIVGVLFIELVVVVNVGVATVIVVVVIIIIIISANEIKREVMFSLKGVQKGRTDSKSTATRPHVDRKRKCPTSSWPPQPPGLSKIHSSVKIHHNSAKLHQHDLSP